MAGRGRNAGHWRRGVRVGVLLPARNAGSLLLDCLAAVQRQTRAPDEVLVVVGPSADDTASVAHRLAGPTVHVLDNPAGDRGSAINVALAASNSDVVAIVDAQARIGPDYLERALAVMERIDAAVVGGPMRPVGRTPIGRAMAAALQSPFGIGDSQFHFAGTAREVESVYLGVYRASVFTSVGGYNPALLRTEDDDLNWRVRAAGLRIWLDPAIHSTYLCRDSLGAIWRQYHGYGYWKVALATMRPGAIRMRHLVPAVFVLALLGAMLVSIIASWPVLPLLVGAYVVAAVVAGAVTPADGLVARLLFPLVTLTMHVAYGTGTLRGLLAWSRLRSLVRDGARS
jgi:succinoglycan biosynthesis protein ExoA